jgi:hypothetical protein
MSIPLSASEKSEFTPASLANLPVAPVFLFRPATQRDARRFGQICSVEGLNFHTKHDQRAIFRAELKRLWDPAAFDTEMAKLEELWNTLDHNDGLPEAQRVAIDPEALDAAADLEERLVRASRVVRQMAVDNQNFMADAPKLALGLFLIGWRGIKSPFRKEAGAIPLDCIDDLEAALKAMETEARDNGVQGIEPGTAFIELSMHAFDLLALTGAEAGNSASPSAPGPTPNCLSPAHSPPVMTAGGSQEPGRSKKTRRGGSAATTSN